jgi:AcrR family transcriptional regulator
MAIEQKMSRERILEGAVAILDSGQCADLTVDALARSLRMSKSTLYKYFDSKEDVVVSMVRSACEHAESELKAATRESSPGRQLSAVAAVMGRHGQRLPRAVIVDGGNLPRACAARLEDTRRAFYTAAEEIVARGLEERAFQCTDGRLAAIAFVAAAEAVLLDGARRGIESFGQRLEALSELFLPGLLAPQ